MRNLEYWTQKHEKLRSQMTELRQEVNVASSRLVRRPDTRKEFSANGRTYRGYMIWVSRLARNLKDAKHKLEKSQAQLQFYSSRILLLKEEEAKRLIMNKERSLSRYGREPLL